MMYDSIMNEVNRTCLVIPDLQIPLHDMGFVEKLIDVAEYLQPEVLLFIGDLTDSTEVGRWVKGKHGEYTGDLQAAFDEAADIVAGFRYVVGDDCEMILQDSNHDARTQEYINSNAPALSSLRSLELGQLLRLDRHGVSYLSGLSPVLPSVFSLHGHERPYTSVPGKWGLDRVREHGVNIVYGHTHTPGLFTTAVGTGAERKNLWAMNVGHGMDMSKATYLTDGYATWCQAFGVVTWDGELAHPELVLAPSGKFHWEGKTW